MNITLSNTNEITTALENYRASEIDKLYRMKMQLQAASKAFEFINVSSELETQINILLQADNEQLAQMYLQKNLLDEYETFTNDPQFILGTNVEATLLIYKKGSNEYVQPTYYNTVKQLHDDLIHTVDEHYSDFTESQYTIYEAALEGIELALQNIDTLPAEYSQTFAFESTTHKYEVSFFNPF
ncbi:MAG TPA: hypothetical protein VIH12_02220 [Solibacillus sp.]